MVDMEDRPHPPQHRRCGSRVVREYVPTPASTVTVAPP